MEEKVIKFINEKSKSVIKYQEIFWLKHYTVKINQRQRSNRGLSDRLYIYSSIYYLYENDYKTYFIIKIVSLILPLKSERKSM